MKSIARFLPSRSLVRGLPPVPCNSRFDRKIGSDLLSRISTNFYKFLSFNIFQNVVFV